LVRTQPFPKAGVFSPTVSIGGRRRACVSTQHVGGPKLAVNCRTTSGQTEGTGTHPSPTSQIESTSVPM